MFCGLGGVTDSEAVGIFASVITAVSRDPEFAEAFRTEIIGPKIAASQQIWERARARGELRDPTSTSACSNRRWPGSCSTACSSWANSPPRTSSAG